MPRWFACVDASERLAVPAAFMAVDADEDSWRGRAGTRISPTTTRPRHAWGSWPPATPRHGGRCASPRPAPADRAESLPGPHAMRPRRSADGNVLAHRRPGRKSVSRAPPDARCGRGGGWGRRFTCRPLTPARRRPERFPRGQSRRDRDGRRAGRVRRTRAGALPAGAGAQSGGRAGTADAARLNPMRAAGRRARVTAGGRSRPRSSAPPAAARRASGG